MWSTLDCLVALTGIFGLCIAVLFIAVFVVMFFMLPSKKRMNFNGKHAFITGGSRGIGKQLAMGLVRRGCSVSIAARDPSTLKSTCDLLNSLAKSIGNNATAKWYQLDINGSFEEVASVVKEAETQSGPIDILLNNAGTCIQGAFDELSTESFQKQFTLNCLSGVKATHAVVQQMKASRRGHIGFVCSSAGQLAMFGYSAYSASKFAVRGFAESLRMELLPYGVTVSLLFPPNTDTDGYEVELSTMPVEVRLISGAAGLFTAEKVAEAYLNDIQAGELDTSIGLEGWILNGLASATSMQNNLGRLFVQVSLLGVFRVVSLFYMCQFNRIVDKCRQQRQLVDKCPTSDRSE